MNIGKTQAIVIYDNIFDSSILPPIIINNIKIPLVNKVKNLGVMLNSLFTWDNHIGVICSKVYNMLRKLYSISEYIPRSLRKKLIVSLIFPHFIFGDIIFSNLSSSCKRKLKVCFNACLRYIHKRKKFDPISDVENSIVGCSLFTYYKLRQALFIHKIIITQQPYYLYKNLLFPFSNRTNILIIPIHSSLIMSNAFAVSSARLWNTLPIEIRKSKNLIEFKDLCKVFLNFDN